MMLRIFAVATLLSASASAIPDAEGDPYCLDNGVKVTSHEPTVPLDPEAFIVNSSDGGTVTFSIKQKWKNDGSEISWIAPVYTHAGVDMYCEGDDKVDEVLWDQVTGPYTATCEDGIAKVEVFVHDGKFDEEVVNEANYRNCDGWGNEDDVARYWFDVPCDGSDLCDDGTDDAGTDDAGTDDAGTDDAGTDDGTEETGGDSPAINVEKTVHLDELATCFNGKDLEYGTNGEAITYCYEVSNEGDVALDVVVTDPLFPGEELGSMTLQPGETGFVKKVTTIDGNSETSGTASGTSPSGSVVTDTDPAGVMELAVRVCE